MSRRLIRIAPLAALVWLCGCAGRPPSVTYVKTHSEAMDGKTITVRGQVETFDADSMTIWDGPQIASAPEIRVDPCPQGVDRGYVVDVTGKYDAEQGQLHADSCKVVSKR